MTSSQEAISHKDTSRRKKLNTIIFDTDFFNRPRTRKLIKKCGLTAPTIYMAAICWMAYEKSDICLTAKDIQLLAEDLAVPPAQIRAVLDACVEIEYLTMYGDTYVSDRLVKELNIVHTKQNNYKSGRAKREQKQDSRESSPILKVDSRIETNPQSELRMREVRKEQEQEQEEEQEKELEQEQEAERPDRDALTEQAENALEPPDSEVCLKSTVFVNTGRRPMRKYPEIWITRAELTDTFRLYLDSGIPPDKLKIGFTQVAGKLRTLKGEGKTTNNVSAYNWLIGWALKETLEQVTKVNNLKRSEQYLENSRTQ